MTLPAALPPDPHDLAAARVLEDAEHAADLQRDARLAADLLIEKRRRQIGDEEAL